MQPATRAVPSAIRALGPLLLLLCLAAFTVLPGLAGQPPPALAQERSSTVWVAEAEGIIDPPLADYLVRVMREAAEANAQALVIELDTPGGLDTAMRQIIQAELEAEIPVVVYVYPPGARSASAGVYIMMGADVAAMAPQTNLGAATPVSLTGDMDETMQNKVINDAAAYIKGLAAEHGRNTDWVERAVREAVSLTAEEAREMNVIEFVASDRADLLRQLDGYTTVPKGLTLQTADAEVRVVGMTWAERFLHAVVNPNLAFIFLTIGIYGIIFELQSPGVGLGGIIGGISLLLGLYALQALPVTIVGITLLTLAGILFLAEVWVQSGGILGVGGVIALILGGVMLFDSPESFLRVDWTVLAVGGLASLAFLLFVARAVARSHVSPHASGREALVGEEGVVRLALEPSGAGAARGQVMVHGELWTAKADRPIPAGRRVTVRRVDGMTLEVEPEPLEASGEPGAAEGEPDKVKTGIEED